MALPKIKKKGTNENRTISSSKRMMSDFLRSRKKNTPALGWRTEKRVRVALHSFDEQHEVSLDTGFLLR
jgi:hypothetical protein